MLNPVLHLFDPNNGLDLHRVGVKEIPSGSYRVVNAQSRRCITATAPPAVTSPNEALPTISAWRATLPDDTARNHQIWNINKAPVTSQSTLPTKPPPPALQNVQPIAKTPATAAVSIASKTGALPLKPVAEGGHGQLASPKPVSPLSKPAPPAPTFIIESYDLCATSGAGHAFRLDLKEEPVVITDATIHSVLDNTPNGLPIPVPSFGTVSSPLVSPASITSPILTTRNLVASPAGSATSSFVFIKSHGSSRFWLYNPATSLFVGQPEASVAQSEPDLEGAPIEAGDLNKYFLDTQAYVASQETQKGWTGVMSKAVWDAFVKEMNWWTWEFARVDFGPQKGSYRIMHNTTLLALDAPDHTIQHRPPNIAESTWRSGRSISSAAKSLNYTDISSVAATEIDPHARSQVWNILPQHDSNGRGIIIYMISNFSKSTPLLTSPGTPALSKDTPTTQAHWRLISIPPNATAPASAPASAMYLIYQTDTGSFLGLSPFDHRVVSIASGLNVSEFISDLEDHESDEDVLLTWIIKERDLFWANWEWLVWKVVQESWGPEDGVYGIVDSISSKYLDVSPTIYTDPALVILTSPVIPPLGTSWWNIKAAVSDDGTIYYTVRNYRSGAVLDLGAKTRNEIVARRLGAPTGERWGIIRGDDNGTAFNLLKVEVPGTALTTTSNGGISLVPVNKATRMWALQKVEFQITPGTYFLVNVASNLFLSANTFLPDKPLLVRAYKTNDTEQVWIVSAQPGTSDSFFIGASQGGVSASVPPKNSVWTSPGNPNEMFVIAVDNTQSRSGWVFTKQEQSNAYKVQDVDGNLLSVVKGDKGDRMVVLKPDSGADSQLWRAVSINIPPPSTSIAAPSTPTANVPDGLYRIINQHTKLNLALVREVKLGRPDHLLSSVGLDLRAKTQSYSPYELWYISRNRDPLLAPQDQTYLMQSFASALYIDQSDPDAKQRASGLTCWAMARQPLYSTQQWVLRQLSAFNFAITSYATGCLLDVDSSNLVATPLLSTSPTPTQMWQLSPVAAPLTSGNYKISNLYTQTSMSVSSSTPSIVCAQFGTLGPVSFEWRLTTLSDGLYRIESLNGLSCLYADPSKEVGLRPRDQGLDSRWKLRPSSEGSFLIENAANGLVLTLKDGSAEVNAPMRLREAGDNHHIPWQKFVFERLDIPTRSFDDVGSDKVVFGLYTISNARSNNVLSFPPGALVGARPACTVSPSATTVSTTASTLWTIIPAATGYYSLQQSGMSLGHSILDGDSRAPFPIALSDGFDATRWKFLKCDVSGTYRIVNKDTGKLLVEDDGGMIICGVDDGVSLAQQWYFKSQVAPSTSAPLADIHSLSREYPVQNSMFQFINTKTTHCITSTSPTSLPAAAAPRDLEPFSVDSRLQVWVVEQNRDGWYIIKSFPFGNALGARDGGSLVYAANDSSHSFQWKFIQDAKGTTIRCVNRRFLMSVLSAQEGSGILELATDNAGPLQRWTMLRVSGTSPDTGIAQGVYTISLYTQPTVSSAIAAIKNSEAKSHNDATYENKLKNAVTNISTSLDSSFPSPALPTGVDTSAIQAQLTILDWQNSLAVTTMAANVVAFLYTASLPISSVSPQSGARNTNTVATAASELSFDTASAKIAKIVGDLFQKLLQGNNDNVSVSDSTTAAKLINQISKSITLLTDISPHNVQSLIVSLGAAILSQLSGIVNSKPSTTSPSTAAPTLTLSTPASVVAAPSLSQDASQYWMLETISNAPGCYSLSHLTTKQYLVFGTPVSTASSSPTLSVQMEFPGSEGFWKATSQRMGGYALINSAHPKQALCLLSDTTQVGCLGYVADLQPGYSQQRWQLTRSGYYLQNQGENNSVKAASIDVTGNGVNLVPYQLFSQASLLSGARADAYFIWHLVKIDKGYQFVNEHTRSYLFNTGSNGDSISATTTPGVSATWKLAKISDNIIWMQCQDHGRWLALKDANSDSLCLQDPGDKENWKGWQFVSVARTERGTLMTLPRCALVPPIPQDQSLVFSIDPTSLKLVQQHYQPDNAYQRFRSVTFGNSTAYINEATKRVLKHPASTTDIANIDRDCWFVGSDGSISTVSKAGSAVFQKIVKNTGDLPRAPLSYRIQVGASASSGNLVLGVNEAGGPQFVPLDVLDASQLWSYLEWGLGRFIVHVLSSKLLSAASDGTTVILTSGDTYTQEATWTIDVSGANTQDVPSANGFFKLRPTIQSSGASLSLQPRSLSVSALGTAPVLSSTGDFGCRFISTSGAFNFTWRPKMLLTFLESHLPVFVHDKHAPLPVDVGSYLSHSSIVDKAHPAQPPRSYPPLPTSGNGDWVLRTSLPVSDGKTATAYVVVRQTTEPIYINYTDFVIWLFYPPSSSVDTTAGWSSITMRVSNDSKLIDSVYFPDGKHGWVYNLDMNFSTLIDPKANPLRIVKGATSAAKLHVYVPPDLTITPSFPPTTADSDIIDQTKWGFTFDAGGSSQLLEADMLRDDAQGSRPVRPQWMDYIGRWVDSSGTKAVGPR